MEQRVRWPREKLKSPGLSPEVGAWLEELLEAELQGRALDCLEEKTVCHRRVEENLCCKHKYKYKHKISILCLLNLCYPGVRINADRGACVCQALCFKVDLRSNWRTRITVRGGLEDAGVQQGTWFTACLVGQSLGVLDAGSSPNTLQKARLACQRIWVSDSKAGGGGV